MPVDRPPDGADTAKAPIERLVPVAAAVAAEAHHHLPGPATSLAVPSRTTAGEAKKGGACPHTQSPCPALQLLIGRTQIEGEGPLAWASRISPCGSCRVSMKAQRSRLKGLRLGHREREILLAAAAHDMLVVTSPGMARSASTARRRAAQTLARAGLVMPVERERTEPERSAAAQARAAISLTALGRYVVAAYGRFIVVAGKPVRWNRPLARVPLPGREPATLLDEALELARAELRATLDELKRVLLAAVERPIRDPAMLDAVTRHLERKAHGLKELLEPRAP